MATYIQEQEMETYLASWRRKNDETEVHLADIESISQTNKSLNEPMRTKASVISWDDVLILGAQLASIPLNKDEAVNARTIIGPGAKRPMVIETPFLWPTCPLDRCQERSKLRLLRGQLRSELPSGLGEGGVIEDEVANASNYIFEYVSNKYSVTESNLKRASAIEI